MFYVDAAILYCLMKTLIVLFSDKGIPTLNLLTFHNKEKKQKLNFYRVQENLNL